MPLCVLVMTEDDLLYVCDGSSIKSKVDFGLGYEETLIVDRVDPSRVYVQHDDQCVSEVLLFEDDPISIAYSMLVKPNLYSHYEASTRTITYFESFQNSQSPLSKLRLRTYADHYLDPVFDGEEPYSEQEIV